MVQKWFKSIKNLRVTNCFKRIKIPYSEGSNPSLSAIVPSMKDESVRNDLNTLLKVASLFFLFFFFHLTTGFPADETYFIDHPDEPFGTTRNHSIGSDMETLPEIALRYDLGYNEITSANPGIDPWFPGRGREIVIPTEWILPDFPSHLTEKGPLVIINLAEFRLYRVSRINGRLAVMTFPIGIGREGAETPTGLFRVVQKEENPSWHIPPSIRNEYPHLPDTVPPGPGNPLGSHALRLSVAEYLIHGTNKPLGIGRMVSHGCIRMYNRDVERLYRYTSSGDRVLITYQTVKVGIKEDSLYIESHRDYRGLRNPIQEAVSRLRRRGLLERMKTEDLYRIITESRGYPVKSGPACTPEGEEYSSMLNKQGARQGIKNRETHSEGGG